MKRENDFGPAIKDFFFRAGDFKGVSSRPQYWWLFLAQFLLGLAAGVLFGIAIPFSLMDSHSLGSNIIFTLTTLAFSIFGYLGYPQLSLTIRRYRDAKVSPWWYLGIIIISFIGPLLAVNGMGWWLALLFPLIGGIANLVILLLPSREQKVVPFPAQPNTRGTIGVGFGTAVKDFFIRGGDFTGESSRSQYWWSILFGMIIIIPTFLFMIFSIMSIIIGGAAISGFNSQNIDHLVNSLGTGAIIIVFILFAIIYAWSMLALPALTVGWRRFKDAGVSPWWLIAFNVVSAFLSTLDRNAGNVPLSLIALLLIIVQIVILALPTKFRDDEA